MPTDHVIESLQGFATLDDLISLLREKPDCSVVIINDLGNPIGVMHDFDVRHALAHSVRTDVALCELMSTDFTCVTENEYIALATLKPFKTKSETLIVLDDTGTAVRVKKANLSKQKSIANAASTPNCRRLWSSDGRANQTHSQANVDCQ